MAIPVLLTSKVQPRNNIHNWNKANVKVPKSALPLMTTWGCFQKWVSPLDFHIKKNN